MPVFIDPRRLLALARTIRVLEFRMNPFLGWLLSRQPHQRRALGVAEKLHLRLRVTLKCRFNAAARLRQHRKFSFFATTVLSLGMILVPLLQSAGLRLAFPDGVINMVQIFLAVSVLVYSVIIGTANYDVRAERLSERAERLKTLQLSLERATECSAAVDPATTDEHYRRYSDIVSDAENHLPNDYRFAQLEMSGEYGKTGLPRLVLFLQAWFTHLSGFATPALLMLLEMIFIGDMIGVTHWVAPYLGGGADVPSIP
jgi:hypothetical protein